MNTPRSTLKRRGPQAAERTRNAVLQAAVEEFAKRGLAGARVDKIARRAGVNKQALYYHYGNKDALFQAALESGYAQFQPHLREWTAQGVSPVMAMRNLVGLIFDHVHTRRKHSILISDENRYRGQHLTREFRRRVRNAVAPMLGAIGDALERGQREGIFSRAVSPVQLHLTIIGMSMFYFTNVHTLSAIYGEDLTRKPAISERRRHVIEFVLSALRP